jgi:hypothetical protein
LAGTNLARGTRRGSSDWVAANPKTENAQRESTPDARPYKYRFPRPPIGVHAGDEPDVSALVLVRSFLGAAAVAAALMIIVFLKSTPSR